MKKYLSKKYLALFQAVLIFVWLADLSPLAETDTYYSVFLLCGLAGLAGLLDNWRTPSDGLQLCTCLREYLHCW